MLMRRNAIVIVALMSLAWSCGCSSSARAEPRFASADPEVQDEFDEALSLYEEGRLEEASLRFSAFVVNHREDPLRPGAELYLGRIALQQENFDEAVVWLERAAEADDEVLSTTARREMGEALVNAGDPQRAIAVMEPLSGTLDGRDAAQLYQTLARAADAADEPERRLRYLDATFRFGGREDREEAERQIRELVAALDDEALARIVRTLPHNGPGWSAAASRLGVMHTERGEAERARALLEQLEEAGADDDATPLRTAIETMERIDWSAVGVLLPLSGRARLIGEQMRAGIELAAAEETEAPLRLVIRDSASPPEGGIEAVVTEMVQTERVSAIIGPVDAGRAEAAARRANELGVPLLALSIRPDLPATSAWVVRAFQSNRAEVRTLLEYAVTRRGIQTFAVMYPDNGYGRVLRQLVEQEVESYGGRVVTTESYSPTITSFVEHCERLADHEFEALIIPDRSRTVSLIAPSLAAVGLWSRGPTSAAPPDGRGIQMLLPSASFNPALAGGVGRYLQGAVFAVALWTDDTDVATARFVEAFRVEQGTTPTSYASQAHDALQILRAARAVALNQTRASLLEAIRGLDEAPTVGRFEGFEESGEPRSPMHLIELEGDAFRRLE